MSPAHPPLRALRALERIPHSAVALLARLGLGAMFWASGQTKIEGLVLDPIGWTFELGQPRLSEGALFLFREEYRLPVLAPELAATLAALAEHLLPLLLVIGLASRLSALGLLAMTAVIQVFVYPDAWPTHAIWAALLLVIVARGPGLVSIDHLLSRRPR